MSRQIVIDSEFSRGMAVNVIGQIEELDSKSSEDIWMVVCSPGGDVMAMLMIMDAMKRAKSRVGVMALGVAASAGCLLLAAGHKGMRTATPHTRLMIHGSQLQGFFTEMEIKWVEELQDEVLGYSAKYLNLSESEVEEILARDTYLTAYEAKELGIIDTVIENY